MKNVKEAMLLYAVTDRAWVGRQTLYEQAEAALKGGITCLQLREKDLSDEDFFKEALALKDLCNDYSVPFIVNDNVGVAVKCKADGIHVGQSDMTAGDVRAVIGKDMLLGVSAQTVEQALAAEKSGADYLGVGAVFPTATKTDAEDVPRPVLEAICKAVSVPVVAIGGIHKDNIATLARSGVDGVALVSALFAAADIEKESALLRGLSEKMVLS